MNPYNKLKGVCLTLSILYINSKSYPQSQPEKALDSLLNIEQLSKQKVYKSLQEALKEPEKVYVLDLGNQQLGQLSPEIGKLTNLQKLSLYGNELKTLPNELYLLQNLQWLDLYFNQLSDLPDEFAKLKNLYYLDLGTNRFMQIPPEVYQLDKLRHLYLYANKISQVLSEITELKELEYLRLGKGLKILFGGNRIKKLPDNFGELQHLKELYLPDNQLRNLPASFSKLKKLQWLDLSNNRFTKIPPEIQNLDSLKYLTIWDRNFPETAKKSLEKNKTTTRFNWEEDYEGNLWGLIAGFQQGKFSVLELGLTRAFKKDIIALALGASAELNLNGKMQGAKLSAWANGLTIFSLGLHSIYYFDKTKNTFALRPEIGAGLGYFSLTYGYNFLFSKDSENINKHLVALRVIFPICPFTSPFK